jgi:osmoprotectant transport system ATP-binding protein
MSPCVLRRRRVSKHEHPASFAVRDGPDGLLRANVDFPVIKLVGVSKRYANRIALDTLSFEFARGRTTVLVGPSGCGKSTILRMIVGLVAPDTGTVLIEGEALTRGRVERMRHSIGYVIQEGGLFPHLSAGDNVTLLGRHLGKTREALEERVASLAALVRIPPEALARYPQQLSGGQRQRVGIMRALVLDPPILLLDEPLGALDPITRYELQGDLKAIFERLGKTVVLVTHDMGEAAHFADEIVLMREGRILQRGRLADLIEHPADAYVTTFLRAQRIALTSAPVGATAVRAEERVASRSANNLDRSPLERASASSERTGEADRREDP